jgi:hypothetical protein
MTRLLSGLTAAAIRRRVWPLFSGAELTGS